MTYDIGTSKDRYCELERETPSTLQKHFNECGQKIVSLKELRERFDDLAKHSSLSLGFQLKRFVNNTFLKNNDKIEPSDLLDDLFYNAVATKQRKGIKLQGDEPLIYKKTNGSEKFCNGVFLGELIKQWPDTEAHPTLTMLKFSFDRCVKKMGLLHDGDIEPMDIPFKPPIKLLR